jgi:hypothetical protein
MAENQQPDFFTLYRQIGEISATLASVDKKLDGYIAESKKCDSSLFAKVGALEDGANFKKGERAAIGAVSGFAGSVITMVISHFLK